jgi:putative transposase
LHFLEQYKNIVIKTQAFRFWLRPTPEQAQALIGYVGSCRYVYNKALNLQIENHTNKKPHLSAFDLNLLLPKWKKELPWLKLTPSQTLQQSLKNLSKAYKNFFEGRSKFPKHRKRGKHMSMTLPQGFVIDQKNHRIQIPKLGWIKMRNHRLIVGTPKNITISLKADRWYVSVQTETSVSKTVHPSKTAIGIDLGVRRFAAFSDGLFVCPVNSLKAKALKLKKAQRSLSKKTKFSKNWFKALRRVKKIHARIANTRRDFLHKLSATISKNHALVVIEDLKIRNMSRSAKGTLAEPGKNVKAKTGLNRSILDQGWGELRRQLHYKLSWTGGMLITVPPQHTSQTCPSCGHVAKENRKTQAKFACVSCGYSANADHVGAMNILARGHRVLAGGEAGSAFVPHPASFAGCGTAATSFVEAGTILQG